MYFSKISSINNIRDVLDDLQNFIKKNTSDEDCIFNGRLIACELITNVLLHSKCQAYLEADFIDNKLKITVERESECKFAAEFKGIPDCNSPCGRGLFIINSLCEVLERDGKKTTAILKYR